jgi:hypothetical protein
MESREAGWAITVVPPATTAQKAPLTRLKACMIMKSWNLYSGVGVSGARWVTLFPATRAREDIAQGDQICMCQEEAPLRGAGRPTVMGFRGSVGAVGSPQLECPYTRIQTRGGASHTSGRSIGA